MNGWWSKNKTTTTTDRQMRVLIKNFETRKKTKKK